MQFESNEQERSAARYAIPVGEIMNWPVTRLSAPQRVALVCVLRGQRSRGMGSALFVHGTGCTHVVDQHCEALGRFDLSPPDGASRFDEGLAQSFVAARNVTSTSRGGGL